MDEFFCARCCKGHAVEWNWPLTVLNKPWENSNECKLLGHFQPATKKISHDQANHSHTIYGL
jgi:hypothetical protein